MKSLLQTSAVTLLLLTPQALLACPMCKDSIPGSVGGGDPSQMSGGGLPGGFNNSVYIMLLGFFGALGLVGWTLYKGIRSSTRAGFPVATPQAQ